MMLLYCFSCSEGNKKNIIQEKKFEAILYDLHLIEARLEHFGALSDTFYYAAGKGYEQLFEKHGITKTQFEETFFYYQQQPKQFEKLYENVVNKLSEEEAKTRGE